MKLCAGTCHPKTRIPDGRHLCNQCQADRRIAADRRGDTGQNRVRRDQSLRRLVIERDQGCCVGCGIDEATALGRYGLPFDVHHRDGDPRNNAPTNLETRCHGCHNKADKALKQAKAKARPKTWREAREKL